MTIGGAARILVITIALHGLLSARGAIYRRHTAEFCSTASDGTEIITLEDLDTVEEGMLLGEVSGSGDYKTNADGVCKVLIRGRSKNSLIVFNHHAESGACLRNKFITADQENWSCTEQKEHFVKELVLTLQVDTHMPWFNITFKVYPVFVMLSHQLNSSIDASVHPQGYITDLSNLREQYEHGNQTNVLGIKINGLPLTAIVYMDLEFVDMPKFGRNKFFIKTQLQETKDQRNHELFFSDGPIIGIPVQYTGNNPLLLRNEMRRVEDYGELIRIRYFVEWCDSSIANLDKLSPVGSSNSMEFHASCTAGFEFPRNNYRFKCANSNWNPTLECLKKKNLSAIEDDGHITDSDRFTLSQMDLLTVIVLLGVMLGLLLVTILLFSYFFFTGRLRGRILVTKTCHILPGTNTVQESESSTDNPTGENPIDPAHDYESIEATDPYNDYSKIDEHDMLSITSFNQNNIQCETEAQDALPREEDLRNYSATESLSTNSFRCPSPNLMKSISHKLSKRGIHIQEDLTQVDLSRQRIHSIPSTPPMPCRGRRNLRVFHPQQRTVAQVEVHKNSCDDYADINH